MSLADLLANQIKEECQYSNSKKKNIDTVRRKYYKVELPRKELDKFKPESKKDSSNVYENFRLVLLGFKEFVVNSKS